ncbi:MAG: hypothetical protein M3065_16325 [Actinomycetota bacterium]|nr:hypothetical protein [Actinomycetota bacterium]
MLARFAACALAFGLWGASDAYAFTRHQVAKVVVDCTQHCGGPHGTGEVKPSAFGAPVAVSADGKTALIGAPQANVSDGAVWAFARHGAAWRQQGAQLRVDCKRHCAGPNGQGEDGNTFDFGQAIALSANGNTALIGAPGNGERGGAWIFIRSPGGWRQQGPRLIGFCHPQRRRCTGPNGTGLGGFGFGEGVALSPDGNTALIGAPGGAGGVWVFTRAGGRWSQQAKLVGNCRPAAVRVCTGPNGTGEISGGSNTGGFGSGVALSANGGTALIGAFEDGSVSDSATTGAAWVFVRSGGLWSQQGTKLVANCTVSCSGPNGTGSSAGGELGESVALSSDGSTALLGSPTDSNLAGAAWVFTRSSGAWSQQGTKLVANCTGSCGGPNGTGEVNGTDGGGQFATSVALTGDGNTALIGAPDDGACQCGLAFGTGAVWLFTRSGGAWSQQGPKVVGDCTGACTSTEGTGEVNGRLGGQFGAAVSLSRTGSTALIGGPNDNCHGHCDGSVDAPAEGAAWIFSLTGF